MPVTAFCALLSVMLAGALAGHPRQGIDDPAIRAAVDRFFATQEAEDVPGYLALWTDRARPPRDRLDDVFRSGDDKFSDIAITRVRPVGDRILVQVSATRNRTSMRPDGTPTNAQGVMSTNLTFVREGEALKLVAEGPATDALAGALIDAASAAERETLLTADPDLVTTALAMSLSRRADSAVQAGLGFAGPASMRTALVIYDLVLDVARRIGNRTLEGEALQNIGNGRYFLRDFPGALQAYEQRLAVERQSANEPGIAGALLGIATIRYSTYEDSAALISYQDALAIQERLQDVGGAATTRISTGNIRYLQGDFEGAITEYRRSRDGWRKLTSSAGEAQALEGLGRVFTDQGDFAAALDVYAGVLAEARTTGNRSVQGTAIQHIGEIHFRLGNLNTARSLFDESRTHFEAIKDLANIGRVWQAAALTDLVAGRFAPAEQEYTRSSAACSALLPAPDRDCIARAIVGLAFAQASQQHYDEAIATYAKAIAAFSALAKRAEAARAEIGLSQALLGKADYTAALAAAGRVRQQAVALEHDDILWRAMVVEARTLRRLKVPDKAMAVAREATATVQRLSMAALYRPGESVAEDAIGTYALLAVLQVEAGDAAGALRTAEDRRALALRIALARDERHIARGMTALERDAERSVDAELVSLQLQQDHERALPKPDAARLAKLAASIGEVMIRRRDGQQALFERLPDLRIWRGLAPRVAAPDIAKALAEDTVLAEFVVDEDDVVVITAARSPDTGGLPEPGTGVGDPKAGVRDPIDIRAFVSPIARQTLVERVARAVDPAVLRSVDGWRKTSMELASSFPAAALDQIAAAPRAILVPDDVLWQVPFEALPIKAGYLADQTTLTYASSVMSIVSLPTAGASPANSPPVAVAAPELSAEVRDRVRTTAPGWILRTPEGAGAEIQRAVAGLGEPNAIVLEGTSATETAFRTQAPGAPWLHVAAPFAINSASPLFSAVLLAGDPKATSDDPAANGVLEAREIMNLELRAKVTVLSDGAAASIRNAAPAIGTVHWAWRAAGVPSLVLSRWPGDEAAGAELLVAFHSHLQGGDAPQVALQAARDSLRARAETSAPYFWAGWMIVGKSP